MNGERLHEVVALILSLSRSEVSEMTSMHNCDRWDSLQHFNLILAVEQAFGVRFASDRIPHLVSVQALAEELACLERGGA